MSARRHPPAARHGELRELFDDIFFVSGTVRMGGPLPMVFSRNMTVLRHGGALTLVNTMRLDDAGLAALDALGEVERTIRIAGFHGMDDAFYKERYGAEVWALEGMVYAAGFDTDPAHAYLEPDVRIGADTELPIPGASLHRFVGAKVPEGIVVLDRDGGILITGDALQNWDTTEYFSLPAKIVMRMMGFLKPNNVGPGWLKSAKPTVEGMEAVLELPFDHVLPAHGSAVIGDAKALFRPAIDEAITRLRA